MDLMCLSEERNGLLIVEPQCLVICLSLPQPLYYMRHMRGDVSACKNLTTVCGR